jgi:hypothetical protein
MAYFQTENTNLGKSWGVLQWKMSVYFMTIWYILRPFGIFDGYLMYFFPFWIVKPRKIQASLVVVTRCDHLNQFKFI